MQIAEINRSLDVNKNGRYCVLLIIIVSLLLRYSELIAADATNTTNVVSESKTGGDIAARRFILTCSGCHSLSGVKLSGPDLSHTIGWPTEQLKQAIRRMQERVGPLSDSDVDGLAQLLQDPKVRDRLKAEESRIQEQLTAQLEKPDPSIGRDLFYGKIPMKNGGLSCVACHAIHGVGGALAPDLGNVINKMPEPALVSAIEKTSFKIMDAHYRLRPITLQEAVHIAKFLSTVRSETPAPQPKAEFLSVGLFSGLVLFAGIVVYFNRLSATRFNRNLRKK